MHDDEDPTPITQEFPAEPAIELTDDDIVEIVIAPYPGLYDD